MTMLDWLPELDLIGGLVVLAAMGWAWVRVMRRPDDEWQRSVAEHEAAVKATGPRSLP